jgi:hypothetical protein
LGCGKDVCWDCKKKAGIEVHAGLFFSGSGDGFYCNSCRTLRSVVASDLYQAYLKIHVMRQEYDSWSADFEIKRKKAEEELQLLLK